MKKRWLLIVSLLICAVLLLGACSPINKKQAKKSQRLDTVQAVKLDALDADYAYIDSSYDLAVFSKTGDDGKATKKVINIDTGAVIYTFTEGDGKTLSVDNGNLVIATTDAANGNTRYAIYDNGGKLICENVKEYRFVNDCLVYDLTQVVRFDKKTGAVKETYTHAELDGAIPACSKWTDDYYYDISGRLIEVYDKHYVKTMAYSIPEYVMSFSGSSNVGYSILEDGTIVAQGLVEVDAQSNRYDILKDSMKYDLFTIRINPKNGKTQKLTVDFVIANLMRVSDLDEEDNILDRSVKNIAVVAKIIDRKLDLGEGNMRIMSVDSRLKGEEMFVVNGEAVWPVAIGNGYLIGDGAVSDTTYLLSAGMKVLANMDAVRAYTEKYILTSRGIYDYDLKQVEDLSEKDYVYVDTVGNALIFVEETEETTYYLYNGSFKKIADGVTWANNMGKSYYVLKNRPDATLENPSSATIYSYYDADGHLLFTSEGATAYTVASGNDWSIMRVKTADGYAYYRVQR